MNTQLVAKEVKLTQWNALVKECMTSGLKVKHWCQQNNVSKDKASNSFKKYAYTGS